MILSEEEIEKVFTLNGSANKWVMDYMKVASKAQLKKLAEWGDEICPHPSTFDGSRQTKKRKCPICWQALLEEVKH